MTTLAKLDKKRNFAKWARQPEAHDPCLLSFRCTPSEETEEISDNQLCWKGVIAFWDAMVDPSSGTRYVVCSQPLHPRSTGAYFERVGRHMAVVMRNTREAKDGRFE